MKNRNLARSATAAFLAIVALSLAGCGFQPYKATTNLFAGRPQPPSKLLYRIMVSTSNSSTLGTAGTMFLIDASRDLRSSVYNANTTFSISGFAANDVTKVISYPEQLTGYAYSDSDGSLTAIDYSKEAANGAAATLGGRSSDVFVSSDGLYVLAAQETTGLAILVDRTSAINQTTGQLGAGIPYAMSLPGAYKVAVNPAHTAMLVMTRNSNNIYRVIKLNSNTAPPTGYTSCVPQNLPVYCLVPINIAGNAFDRPANAYFSPDGSQVYVLNCGLECGGSASSVTSLPINAVRWDNYSTANIPVNNASTDPNTGKNIPVPGGATVAISDGTTLYVAGQQIQTDNLFAGVLSTVSLASNAVTNTYSISDGTHTKFLFADDNTLWISSINCANGERQAHNQNYNCLTRFVTTSNTAAIVPAVDPTSVASSVPFPNSDGNAKYYGSLTGMAWVEGFHKVYTAYGGQVHAFNTTDGSEINNQNITLQGISLDVHYIDASTNEAD